MIVKEKCSPLGLMYRGVKVGRKVSAQVFLRQVLDNLGELVQSSLRCVPLAGLTDATAARHSRAGKPAHVRYVSASSNTLRLFFGYAIRERQRTAREPTGRHYPAPQSSDNLADCINDKGRAKAKLARPQRIADQSINRTGGKAG